MDETFNVAFQRTVLSCSSDNVVHTFKSVAEILKCDHSNESHLEVLSCGAVDYAVQGDSNS